MELLLGEGADIYAYDPVAAENLKKKFPGGKSGNGSIHYVENAETALKDAHICFIFTEWKEIKALRPEVFRNEMQTPLVYDGRNIFNLREMKDSGVEYYSIGR